MLHRCSIICRRYNMKWLKPSWGARNGFGFGLENIRTCNNTLRDVCIWKHVDHRRPPTDTSGRNRKNFKGVPIHGGSMKILPLSDRKPFPELHEIFMLLRGNKKQRQTQNAHYNIIHRRGYRIPHCPYRAREIVKFLWRLCLAKHINGVGGDQRQTHFRPERPLPAINIYLYSVCIYV